MAVGQNNWFVAGLFLGWQDVKQNYRRSALGQFWITLSTAAMIATLGFVFSQLFGTPIEYFLPYVAAGLIIWNFISTLLTEVMNSFIAAEGLIRELPIPKVTYFVRSWWRSTITFLHNIVLIPLVAIVVGFPMNGAILWLPVGLILLSVFVVSLGIVLAFVATRFRDLGPIVNSLLLVAFYATPVFWERSALPETGVIADFLGLNPFAKFLSIARQPLLGQAPLAEDLIYCAVIAIFMAIIASLIYRTQKDKVAYWI